jgi:outer membrane biosynthesis protein TonB
MKRPTPTAQPPPPVAATKPPTPARAPVAAPVPTPKPAPAPTLEAKAKVVPLRKIKSLQSAKKILISFADIGPWAQLTSISSQGFQVKCILSAPPQGLESREVEFQVKNGPLLKARLSQQIHDEYVFKYVSPSKSDISKLNHWLQHIA